MSNLTRRDRALGKNVNWAKNRADDLAANPAIGFPHPFEGEAFFGVGILSGWVNDVPYVSNFNGLGV